MGAVSGRDTGPMRALIFAVSAWLRTTDGAGAEITRLTVQPSIEGQPQACAVVTGERGPRYIWWTWDGSKVVRHE